MDPIDGELRRALAVDPSPEFLARVRTRIAEEPAPVGRRIPWIAVSTVLAAAALLAMIAIVRRPAPGAQIADVLIARSAADSVGVMPAERRAALGHEPRPRAVRIEPGAARESEVRRGEPEVLIAPDEARAIRQLILGVQQGRIDLPPALATAPTQEIVVEPIGIAPIPSMTIEQGVRQ